MRHNKYQQYLNEERASSRSSRIKEQIDNAAKFAIGISAIVGGGIGARHLYKSGQLDDILSGTGSALNKAISDGRSTAMRFSAWTDAAKKTTKKAGVWKTVVGEADDTFEANLRRNLERVNSNLKKPLSGVDTQIEALLAKRGRTKSEAIKSYIEGHRLDSVIDDFGNVAGRDGELFKDINKVLRGDSKGRLSLDKAKSDDLYKLFKTEGLVEKHGENKTKNTALEISKILENYRDNPSQWAKPLSQEHLRKKAKQLGNIIDEDFMKLLESKDNARSKFLEKIGIRRATVDDALKHPEWFEGSQQYTTKRGSKGKVIEGKFVPRDTYKKLKSLSERNPGVKKLTLGKAIMLDVQSGDLIDSRYIRDAGWKAFEFASDNIQVPFVNINPLRLAHAITIEGVHNAEPMTILRKGTRQLFLQGREELSQDFLYSGNKVYSIKTGEILKDDVYLASSRYGLFKRIAENMGEYGEQKTGNWVKRTFDIGLQERESEFKRGASFFNKFFDPKWEPNLIHGMERQYQETGKVAPNVAEAAYKKIYDTLNRKVQPLDSDTMRRLAPSLEEMFPGLNEEDIAMETNEQVMITLGKLISIEAEGAGPVYSKYTGLLGQLRGNASLFEQNKDVFEMIQQAVSDPEVALPNFLESLQPSATRMVSKYEDTRRIVQEEMIAQLQAHKINIKGVLGDVTNKEQKQLAEMQAFGSMRRLWRDVYEFGTSDEQQLVEDKRKALSNFIDVIVNPNEKQKEASEAIKTAVNEYSPWWGYGPGQKPSNALEGSPYIVVNKTRNPIKEVNEVLKQGGDLGDAIKSIADTTVGQMGFDFGFGFRAGRKNPDKVTTLSAASYYYFDRLNEGLGRAGLGLSQKSLGSAQDVFNNLLLKRYGAVAVGIAGLKYLDYETENITGVEPSETLGKAYVNMTMDVAGVKDITGLTHLNKMMKRIMPGSEKLFANPLGGAVKYGTFGLVGDDRSRKELQQYWEEGEDPVRRGRWWGIGSNTPWYGGKIDHWKPNWYRMAKSDYKYTDVLYGSKDEYWANHWMPTPSHPFAPIKRFLIDPNHWANKHREDRPYPIYGGYSELNEIPIIGPTLNGTIGQVLNPERRRGDLRKAHRQYLQDINESIKNESNGSKGGYVYVTPAGRTSVVSVNSEMINWGEGVGSIGTMSVGTESGNVVAINATEGFAPMESGKTISNLEVASVNQGIIAKASISPSKSNNLESLRDDDYVENLDEAVDPRSLSYRFGETFYSLSEMGGIYGFAFSSITGLGDMASDRPVMSRAMDMNSASRMFWDQQLGGAGGDVSEIGRRFIPRKRTEKQYNPYRNIMPEWMPGLDYFTDFRHGDPYSKIAGGEYRLPGAGYESLNRLHPDMFGEYGAIDRFKILADVAPYSDQYKYYKGVLSKYNQMGWLTDGEKEDISTVKDQVREAKKKYDFTHYKFKYADIDEKYVTVDYMIDDITFVAEEFPGHPIRLAGVDAPPKSDNSDAAEAAREYIRKQLKPGKRVKIGIDSDALFTVRDDTMQTMRAVVYDSHGHSMSSKLARGKWNAFMGIVGGETFGEAEWDDNSATAVNALHTQGEITVGKAWEFISHLDTPLHNVFLQNRSPLEQYKRRELYGKNWQSWTHPIRDWLNPSIRKRAESNPLIATAMGTFIGALFGGKGSGRKVTATIGGIVAGGASTLRVASETAHRVTGDGDYTWIPKVRKREREIEEYFDVLEYVKYKGLYEKTRRLAIRKEGIDVEKFLGSTEESGGKVQARRRALEEKKRWIKINMANPAVDSEEAKEELDEINAQLNEFSSNSSLVKLGPLALQAVKYRTAYESTLYGADPYGDTVKIYRAMPKKDREFFKEFLLAAPEEREEILRLVPENQRRFYQAKWGLKIDKKPSLGLYFEGHYLPDASWEGWKPDVSLEAVKLKVVQTEALDIGEFGFYPGDEKKAIGAPDVKPFKPSGFLNMGRLRQALRGMGLNNVDIKHAVEPAGENGFNISVNLNKDRRQEIRDTMNSDLSSMISV